MSRLTKRSETKISTPLSVLHVRQFWIAALSAAVIWTQKATLAALSTQAVAAVLTLSNPAIEMPASALLHHADTKEYLHDYGFVINSLQTASRIDSKVIASAAPLEDGGFNKYGLLNLHSGLFRHPGESRDPVINTFSWVSSKSWITTRGLVIESSSNNYGNPDGFIIPTRHYERSEEIQKTIILDGASFPGLLRSARNDVRDLDIMLKPTSLQTLTSSPRDVTSPSTDIVLDPLPLLAELPLAPFIHAAEFIKPATIVDLAPEVAARAMTPHPVHQIQEPLDRLNELPLQHLLLSLPESTWIKPAASIDLTPEVPARAMTPHSQPSTASSPNLINQPPEGAPPLAQNDLDLEQAIATPTQGTAINPMDLAHPAVFAFSEKTIKDIEQSINETSKHSPKIAQTAVIPYMKKLSDDYGISGYVLGDNARILGALGRSIEKGVFTLCTTVASSSPKSIHDEQYSRLLASLDNLLSDVPEDPIALLISDEEYELFQNDPFIKKAMDFLRENQMLDGDKFKEFLKHCHIFKLCKEAAIANFLTTHDSDIEFEIRAGGPVAATLLSAKIRRVGDPMDRNPELS